MNARRLLASLGLAALILAGCATPPNKTGSPRLASVIIQDRSTNQIAAALTAAFGRHEYKLMRHKDDAMVFEKRGTLMNNLAYGDWYGGSITDRVGVYQKDLGSGKTLVDCDAWMVQDADDPFFEKPRSMGSGRRSTYQKILDEAEADLLKEPAAPTSLPSSLPSTERK